MAAAEGAGAAAEAKPASLGYVLYSGATDWKAIGRSPVKEEVRRDVWA